MALRDHSLDGKIQEAALKEFSEKGYREASLRKIAEEAGATVGAIRTRFKTKDDLFTHCVSPLLAAVAAVFPEIKEIYEEKTAEPLPHLKAAMQAESALILEVLFSHYEEAQLLLCRSEGSSLEHAFEEIVRQKTKESIAFLGEKALPAELLRFLISLQFRSYGEIVGSGCDQKTAKQYMDALIRYHFGGWCALFDSMNQEGNFS